ncbi:uncharacterized protein PAC_01263 [Phialocephala subalpina]|uniref:Uncharacterized protein n=1 Tax=Phialocephala subalpina TaxID=576137 RepID=A0A1L7WF62_9HELO|nr:uncharacterized protein PAC_01263 [Phialocephala subalpina]
MADPTLPPMYRAAMEWKQNVTDPFCNCYATWKYTGSPYATLHRHWSTVLRCINEKKIIVRPPQDKQIAIEALDKATWRGEEERIAFPKMLGAEAGQGRTPAPKVHLRKFHEKTKKLAGAVIEAEDKIVARG